MGAAWLNFLAGEMWAELENIENNNNIAMHFVSLVPPNVNLIRAQ